MPICNSNSTKGRNGRWSLDADLAKARESYAKLQEARAELEERTEWSRSLDRELRSAREAHAILQEEFGKAACGQSRKLDAELDRTRQNSTKERNALESAGRNSKSVRNGRCNLTGRKKSWKR